MVDYIGLKYNTEIKSKSEYRNPKQIRISNDINSKHQNTFLFDQLILKIWPFEFW